MSDDATFRVDDRRLPPFVWIHREIARRYARILGPGPLALYVMLASYCDEARQCWPSLPTLAADIGVTLNTLKGYKERLEYFQLIRADLQEFSRHGKRWEGYLFTLLDPPVMMGVKNSPPYTNGQVSDGGQKLSDGGQKLPPELDPGELDPGEADPDPPSLPPPAPDPEPMPASHRRRHATEADRAEANAILRYLNTVTGHQWGSRNLNSALYHILACVRKGATAEDGRLVIDWCYTVKEVWTPGFRTQYLNPVTPFRESNYETYRDYAREWEEAGRPPANRWPPPAPARAAGLLSNPRTATNVAAMQRGGAHLQAQWAREEPDHEA